MTIILSGGIADGLELPDQGRETEVQHGELFSHIYVREECDCRDGLGRKVFTFKRAVPLMGCAETNKHQGK